jgi:hypothetical protein
MVCYFEAEQYTSEQVIRLNAIIYLNEWSILVYYTEIGYLDTERVQKNSRTAKDMPIFYWYRTTLRVSNSEIRVNKRKYVWVSI